MYCNHWDLAGYLAGGVENKNFSKFLVKKSIFRNLPFRNAWCPHVLFWCRIQWPACGLIHVSQEMPFVYEHTFLGGLYVPLSKSKAEHIKAARMYSISLWPDSGPACRSQRGSWIISTWAGMPIQLWVVSYHFLEETQEVQFSLQCSVPSQLCAILWKGRVIMGTENLSPTHGYYTNQFCSGFLRCCRCVMGISVMNGCSWAFFPWLVKSEGWFPLPASSFLYQP